MPAKEGDFAVLRSGGAELSLRGAWDIRTVEQLRATLSRIELNPGVVIDGSALESLDTAGAMALVDALHSPGDGAAARPALRGFSPEHERIARLVFERYRPRPWPAEQALPRLAEFGKAALDIGAGTAALLSFFGEAVVSLWRSILNPKLIRFKELFVQLERTCVYAIPIVSLVTFLIGIVVAYLSATQLQKYGASIFLVDGIGIGMTRELSPVLVAIIVAGRSGSAFTAQIGAMKINEEIDALRALGLSPMYVLVLPRLLALLLAMPLLTFVGDVVGVAAGAVIGNELLGLSYQTFMERLQDTLLPRHFYIGIGKAPVFAVVVALIGCRMGMAVENTATSVGNNTTSTVVQSIVAVILIDAAFAVVFSELGL